MCSGWTLNCICVSWACMRVFLLRAGALLFASCCDSCKLGYHSHSALYCKSASFKHARANMMCESVFDFCYNAAAGERDVSESSTSSKQMDHFQAIYSAHATEYHRMIAA